MHALNTHGEETGSQRWERSIRIAFWTFGIAAGGLLSYTTRFFLNGDGINYIEMGESVRLGHWAGLVNLTESPGYPVLLGVGHLFFDTTPETELPLLKIVNFLIFCMAMAACDLFVRTLRREWSDSAAESESRLPYSLASAVAYATFLFTALAWVRPQTVAPDMLVFAVLLVAMSIILRIRQGNRTLLAFAFLGAILGIGYFVKAFFFVFSSILFLVAGASTGSLKKAISGILIGAVTMLIVSSPLIISLSSKVGRFSYSEVGRFGFVRKVGFTGKPIHEPVSLMDRPAVHLYRNGPGGTYPSGHDLAYWIQGLEPKLDFAKQSRMVAGNVIQVIFFAPWLLVLGLGWVIVQWRVGRLEFGSLFPLSTFFILLTPAAAAIGIYCLLHVEPRYLAPFFFLALAALLVLPRYQSSARGLPALTWISSLLVVIVLCGTIVETCVDQSIRALRSKPSKPSHRQVYFDNHAIKDYLLEKGVGPGAETGIVGLDPRPPVYWARIGGFTVPAVIPNSQEYLHASSKVRERVARSLKQAGVKALVARGKQYGALSAESWKLVPGTRDFYVLLL